MGIQVNSLRILLAETACSVALIEEGTVAQGQATATIHLRMQAVEMHQLRALDTLAYQMDSCLVISRLANLIARAVCTIKSLLHSLNCDTYNSNHFNRNFINISISISLA